MNKNMLEKYCIPNIVEAGCDEAGRGPLAGSVFAAAVVWSSEVIENEANREWLEMLDDSKKLSFFGIFIFTSRYL